MTVGQQTLGQPQVGPQAREVEPPAQAGWVRARGLVACVLCVGAALAGQWLLDQRASIAQGWSGALHDLAPVGVALAALGLYLLAAGLWVPRLAKQALEAPTAAVSNSYRHAIWRSLLSTGLVAGAIALGVLAYPQFTGNRFSRDGTILWLLGLPPLALAAWLWDRGFHGRAQGASRGGSPIAFLTRHQGLYLSWYQVGLLMVMAVGAFYRFYRLNIIPLEMGPDLSYNYYNIRQILRGEYPIFFPSHPGREALFFYLAAPFCRLFGLNHTNIKIVGSLVGLATLPAVYLLGKELYNREVGLYAAFFLGISRWHIILGRVGYRASLVPLIIALTWYFLLRGFKTGRAWFYGLAGLFLGLGMYTYNAFMVAPLVVLGLILAQFLVGRARQVLAHTPQVLLLLIVALYVFIPLGRLAMEQPGVYGYRAATRVTSVEQPLPANLLGVLSSNVTRALLMFNVQGDGVFVANVPFERELGYLTATLFALGLVHVLWRWRAGQNVTIPLVGMGMLMPSAMALAFPNEVPNAIRAIGVLPAAMLLSGVALMALRRQVASSLAPSAGIVPSTCTPSDTAPRPWGAPLRRLPGSLLVILVVVALGIETWSVYPFYFRDYVAHLPDQNYSISLQMARAIDAFADDGQSYIKIAPYWYDGNAVRAQLRRADPNWNNELGTLDLSEPPLVGPAGRYMVILHPDDQAGLLMLRQAFPRGIALVNLDNSGRIAFITFYGER